MTTTIEAATPAAHSAAGMAALPNEPGAVHRALQQVLASDGFCKAQRMRRLLRFLVDKRLAGAVRETSEYAIGIDVFDRDPSTYSTCLDPIVRVQIGRLRDKLKGYYAAAGLQVDVRFSIPVGSYMPEIELMHKVPPAVGRTYLLAIAPLAFFGHQGDGLAFARGLNEELAYRLFRTFGQTIVSHTFAAQPDGAGAGVSHQLEGSVRIHGEQVRCTIRLVDSVAGCIVWSGQFDECCAPGIALQEILALAICAALEQYFALG